MSTQSTRTKTPPKRPNQRAVNFLDFTRKPIAIVLSILMLLTSFGGLGWTASLKASAATGDIALSWTTTSEAGLPADECHFSDVKTATLNVNLTVPSAANQTVEVTVGQYLTFDGFSKDSNTDNFCDSVTKGTGADANKVTLALKSGMTGSFTVAFTVHFNEKTCIDEETADITAVAKNNGTAEDTQTQTLKEHNPSKPFFRVNPNRAPVPNGWVRYDVYHYNRYTKNGVTKDQAAASPGIGGVHTLIFPVPDEVDQVEILQAHTGTTVTYDSVNRSVKIVTSDFVNEPITMFRMHFKSACTVGNAVTRADGAVATYSGDVANGKHALTASDLAEPLPDLTARTANLETAPAVEIKPLNIRGNNTYSYLIDHDDGDTMGAGNGGLYAISATNNTPFDLLNLELQNTVPDGLYATGFVVPQMQALNTSWTGTMTFKFNTNKRSDVLSNAYTAAAGKQFVTKDILGLASDEYIKDFTIILSNFRAGDTIYNHSHFYNFASIGVLGYVGDTYQNGTAIQEGEVVPDNVIKAVHNATQVGTNTMVKHNYTHKERISPMTYLRYVMPDNHSTTVTNNAFYPGQNGCLRLTVRQFEEYHFSNVQRLKDPILYLVLPDTMNLDLDNITFTTTPAGITASIVSAVKKHNTNIPAGNTLYEIKTAVTLTRNGRSPSSSQDTLELYVPFTVNRYAVPGTYSVPGTNPGETENFFVMPSAGQAVVDAYQPVLADDKYDFDNDGDTTKKLVRCDNSKNLAQLNFAEYYEVIPTGFNVAHQIKSDNQNVWKPYYTPGEDATIAHFVPDGTGKYQVVVTNASATDLDSYVQYITLPQKADKSKHLGLANALTTIPAGFKVEYTTAPTPSRNELVGGSGTDTLYATTVANWSDVTGLKITATSKVLKGTSHTFNFDLKAPAGTDYDIPYVGSSELAAKPEGGVADNYTLSELAADLVNDKANMSGIVYLDANKNQSMDGAEAGLNNVTVELYNSTNQKVGSDITKTVGGVAGVYSLPDIPAGSYTLKFIAPDTYTKTSVNLPGVNAALTQTAAGGNITVSSAAFTLTAYQNVTGANLGLNAQYGYTVEYYKNSATAGNIIGSPVNGTTKFDLGHTMIASEVQADLGAGWLDAKKPAGYNVGAATYPTLSATAANNVVKVVYAAQNFNVSYNANPPTGKTTTGTVPATTQHATDASVTVAGNTGTLAIPGYTFGGWAKDSATSTTPVTAFTMPGQNVTMYAIWTAQSYSVTYHANAPTGKTATGTVPATASYAVDTNVTVAGNTGSLAITGYTFGGWAKDSATSKTPSTSFAMPAAAVNMYAIWTPVKHNVVYHDNVPAGETKTGSVPATAQHDYESTVTVAANTGNQTRAGYTFSGWNTQANGQGTSYAATGAATFTMPNAAVDLYAVWTPNDYEVRYDGNGNTGGTVPAAPTDYPCGSMVTVRANSGSFVKTGATFAGWNTAADGSGTAYAANGTDTFKMPAHDVVLYAMWTDGTFRVTYNANTGTGVVPVDLTEYPYDTEVTVLPQGGITKAGHSFAGWNTQANGQGTAYAAGAKFNMPASNVTLYAQWTPVPVTLTYHGNTNTGGTAPASVTRNQGTVVAVSTAGTLLKTGYTFSGWNTKADGTGTAYAAGASLTLNVDTDLYAQWTLTPPQTVDITYNGNGNTGGTAPDKETVTKGDSAKVKEPGDLERDGYVFDGWNTKPDGTGTHYDPDDTITPTDNTTLYAQWTPIVYKVVYDKNGADSGTVPATKSYASGVTVTVEANSGGLGRVGMAFDGWNTKADGTGTAYRTTTAGTTTFTMPAQDVTLYAQWKEATKDPDAPEFVKIPGQKSIKIGDTVDYTIKNFGNIYGTTIKSVDVVDNPPVGLDFVSGKMPAFKGGAGVTYDIQYKTNKNNFRTLKSSVDASKTYNFTAPILASGEYISEIVVTFENVPADFAKGDEIIYTFKVNGSSSSKELINKAWVGYTLKEGDNPSKSDAPDKPVDVDDGKGKGNTDDDDDTDIPVTGTDVAQYGCILLALGSGGLLALSIAGNRKRKRYGRRSH